MALVNQSLQTKEQGIGSMPSNPVKSVHVAMHEGISPSAAAHDLMAKTVVDDNNTYTIPVDLRKIADMLGIRYLELPISDDGLLVKNDPQKPFTAVVNDMHSDNRKRFTFAHELGHYIHRYQNFPDDKIAGKVEKRNELSSSGTDPEEIWANRFAAALLMPASAVRTLWAAGKSPQEMAHSFGVSEQAINIRLLNLHLV